MNIYNRIINFKIDNKTWIKEKGKILTLQVAFYMINNKIIKINTAHNNNFNRHYNKVNIIKL